jgi:hypothetical protein
MKFRLAPVLRALAVPVFLLCLGHIKAAEPSFAGSYKLSNIIEDNTKTVQLTMTVNLFNPRSSEIRGGVVALLDSTPHSLLLGSFGTIKVLPRAGRATIAHDFTIPAAEYARWQQGHPPVLRFIVPGAEGAVAADIQAYEVLKPVVEAR